jgi:hypothetical protein
MKNKTIFFFSLCVLFTTNNQLFSQSTPNPNKSDIKTAIWTFTLPDDATYGPMDINAKFEYFFLRETFGDKSYLGFNIKVTEITYATKFNGSYRFKYHGKVYKHIDLQAWDSKGMDGFTNVKITGFHFTISVNGIGSQQNCNSYNYASNLKIAEIGKTVNLNSFDLNFVHSAATDIRCENISNLIDRINNYEKGIKNKKEYDNAIQKADQAFQSKNWSGAKQLYNQASTISPNENHPKNQLEKIKQEEDNVAASNNSNSTSNSSNSYNQNPNTNNSQNNASNQGAIDEIQKTDDTDREQYEKSKRDAELAQAIQIQKSKDDYAAKIAADKAKIEQTQILVETTLQFATSIVEQWNQDRERKWAAERAAYEKHKTSVDENRIAYSTLVSSTNDFLFKDKTNYLAMLKFSLPNILTLPAVTWDEALGTSDYNSYFGKDVSYVNKKENTFASPARLTSCLKKGDFQNINLPSIFTPQNLKLVRHDNAIYYWVKTDFFAHYRMAFIFDYNDILVGIRLHLLTDNQGNQIHIKDYYDDLKKNIESKYFMASGNIFVTYDKIFILEFDYLTIYDLNYLNPNTFFNFPVFKDYFNSDNCLECINQIGIKIQGVIPSVKTSNEGVEIKEVLPNSLAKQNNLLPGDIILKINQVSVKYPYHVQWYFYGFPNEKTINLTIKRANKIENILINI